MNSFFDDVYGHEEYAYGKMPNEYLKEKLRDLKPGKILFPAEGEGRNAVYAAKSGWDVFCFDISANGCHKAKQLADEEGVTIDYSICGIDRLPYPKNSFDVIALIYPPKFKKSLIPFLKPGGFLIFESFSKRQLEFNRDNEFAGGPSDINQLYSTEEVRKDFEDFRIIELCEKEVFLQEGIYHNGAGSVIRFFGEYKGEQNTF
ncbi:class I SAM-dependent methyltransferase [Elizabethkingia meningoseptica]|uniref:class I SAM-dependent methyltransferase n=1 Tax=Elizabethkingia meningoseptica TaxID=238 RepID=UPI000841B0DC|nr:class I SAM-dependent methyltransferase [Elizabethkingia meningoseptica]MDE5437450.1 class I SAM-dependent methyltransferase [Elizabethkingia meningoseptica]MDE5507452.1 class I SAM-dependent methyltransferase [Elizabethkingia meningoseptica]MDE5515266.1 class I SAM-dependent methyltransferase [Elizabethkingia meningoseptica]MDE5529532.1 class I SAM-dependent methyltransferase [Elizabethkingia meningoseptica]MDE5533088.1 class I SAM-dependent methyltransferase [Elizabethkingia meningoseptic